MRALNRRDYPLNCAAAANLARLHPSSPPFSRTGEGGAAMASEFSTPQPQRGISASAKLQRMLSIPPKRKPVGAESLRALTGADPSDI
ncbi:MAG TPA: hypothetical protein VJY34_25915 [Roseiarcus sp.]|nr:hypothetical protein [Roseiarcus sp.]